MSKAIFWRSREFHWYEIAKWRGKQWDGTIPIAINVETIVIGKLAMSSDAYTDNIIYST